MTKAVLDSSALLALMLNESGGNAVDGFLPGAAMSSVNVAEVVGKLMRHQIPENEIRAVIMDSGVEIVPFAFDDAIVWGKVHKQTREQGLSLADCACLALGLRLRTVAVTADRAWENLDIGVSVEVIR